MTGSARSVRSVLMLHERFAPDTAGGGEYVALERAKGLIAAGIKTRVICPGDPSITEIDTVPTTRIRLPRSLFGLALPQLVKAARDADIIHCFSYYSAPVALLVGKVTSTPVVCEQIALFGKTWTEMHAGFKGRLMRWLERRQLGLRYDALIFLSPASRDLAIDIGPLRSRTNVVLTPGISHSVPADNAGVDQTRDTVIFAGKFDTRKGIDRLLGMARDLPDISFRAVGWTEDENLPEDLPPNLEMLHLRGSEYLQALQNARIFFFPSRAETFGLVIYEAMAAGCSIVSTIPGPYQGHCLDPYDHEAARKAILARWHDTELNLQEGNANARFALSLTWENSTEDVLDLYETILNSRKAPENG